MERARPVLGLLFNLTDSTPLKISETLSESESCSDVDSAREPRTVDFTRGSEAFRVVNLRILLVLGGGIGGCTWSVRFFAGDEVRLMVTGGVVISSPFE